ncbi:MAG: hypothetical protein A4S09_13940 [Proteobacteria bacterium SG_bin7]|nr:MAG: hypothetical protein A4S09_13940 [Proteobacteria bacterium SG_bin7]
MKEFRIHGKNFFWLDLVNPSKKELAVVAKENSLSLTLVADCLDPEHLPKYEESDTYTFIILRAFDPNAPKDGDTVQELTRKLAIFVSENFLITIHRKELSYVTSVRERWEKINGEAIDEDSMPLMINEILLSVIESYRIPISNSLDDLEKFEMATFGASGAKSAVLLSGYYLRRKASVYKRMLRMTGDIVYRVQNGILADHPHHGQNLKESIDGLYFFADELLESSNNILNLHISLSAQKTNEVMRILTLFSVFFLPLNFIASIYGMNFEFMPEIKSHYGYPVTLTIMGAVALGIYFWFRRKKWI